MKKKRKGQEAQRIEIQRPMKEQSLKDIKQEKGAREGGLKQNRDQRQKHAGLML